MSLYDLDGAYPFWGPVARAEIVLPALAMFQRGLSGSRSGYLRRWFMSSRFGCPCLGNLLVWAAALCLPFCMGGCGIVPVAPESHVERNLEILDKAMSDGDWRRASSLLHSKMSYETASLSLKGSAAAKAFLKSIRDIQGMNEIHTSIHKMKKVNEDRVAVAATMQAHITLSSMALKFSNSTWQVKMLWVRVGSKNWKLASVKETSTRAHAQTNRGGM